MAPSPAPAGQLQGRLCASQVPAAWAGGASLPCLRLHGLSSANVLGTSTGGVLGAQGQVHAVWSHRVSPQDISTIQAGRFPVLVIHGRHDLLAAPKFGEALAKRCGCSCRPVQLSQMRFSCLPHVLLSHAAATASWRQELCLHHQALRVSPVAKPLEAGEGAAA